MPEDIICESEVDHEELAGEEVPDPWDDPDQTDWPNETVGEDV